MSGSVPHFVSGVAPDWCRWVPMKSQEGVPGCGGYVYPGSFTGYGCANWCHWVPDASWGNTYGCNECAGLYSGHTKSADKSGCQKGCQWVSRPCWRNTSDCNQCEQPMNSTKSMKTGLKVRMQAAREPDWCKWVPSSSLQYVDECKGLRPSNPSCSTWCEWVPSTAWKSTEECMSCPGHGPNVTTGSPGCSHWCNWVPHLSWPETRDCFGCKMIDGVNGDSNTSEILP